MASVGVPVVRQGRVTHLIIVALNLRWFDELLARQDLPEGGVLVDTLDQFIDTLLASFLPAVDQLAVEAGDVNQQQIADGVEQHPGFGQHGGVRALHRDGDRARLHRPRRASPELGASSGDLREDGRRCGFGQGLAAGF